VGGNVATSENKWEATQDLYEVDEVVGSQDPSFEFYAISGLSARTGKQLFSVKNLGIVFTQSLMLRDRASLLLSKSPFEQVCGANIAMMRSRTSKVSPTGLQILLERFHRRWIKIRVSVQQILCNHLGHLAIWRIVSTLDKRFYLSSVFLRNLVNHIENLVHQASLAQAVWPCLPGQDLRLLPHGSIPAHRQW
jgi:hypothetical protein